jgi:hypothetical protein
VLFHLQIIALCATGFLLGPRSQCTKMWHPCRRYTTAFYLIMLIVVLVVAVLKQNIFLILFLLLIEVFLQNNYSMAKRLLFCLLTGVSCLLVWLELYSVWPKHGASFLQIDRLVLDGYRETIENRFNCSLSQRV